MKKTYSDNVIKIFMTLLFGFVGGVVVFVLSLLVFGGLGVDAWHTLMYAAIASLLSIAVVFLISAARRMV